MSGRAAPTGNKILNGCLKAPDLAPKNLRCLHRPHTPERRGGALQVFSHPGSSSLLLRARLSRPSLPKKEETGGAWRRGVQGGGGGSGTRGDGEGGEHRFLTDL